MLVLGRCVARVVRRAFTRGPMPGLQRSRSIDACLIGKGETVVCSLNSLEQPRVTFPWQGATDESTRAKWNSPKVSYRVTRGRPWESTSALPAPLLCRTETSFTRRTISATGKSSIYYLHGTRKTDRSEVAQCELEPCRVTRFHGKILHRDFLVEPAFASDRTSSSPRK